MGKFDETDKLVSMVLDQLAGEEPVNEADEAPISWKPMPTLASLDARLERIEETLGKLMEHLAYPDVWMIDGRTGEVRRASG